MLVELLDYRTVVKRVVWLVNSLVVRLAGSWDKLKVVEMVS